MNLKAVSNEVIETLSAEKLALRWKKSLQSICRYRWKKFDRDGVRYPVPYKIGRDSFYPVSEVERYERERCELALEKIRKGPHSEK